MTELYAKMTNPENGWPYDVERAQKFLAEHDKEEILLVSRVKIGGSSTDIYLAGVPGGSWNSVQFTFFVEGGDGLEEYDIFRDEYNLPQVVNVYTPIKGW